MATLAESFLDDLNDLSDDEEDIQENDREVRPLGQQRPPHDACAVPAN